MIRARSASLKACDGTGRSASGRRSPCCKPSPAFQRRSVRASMPPSAQAGASRAPSAQACSMSRTRIWRSSRRVMRPRLGGRPPRVFLIAQARRLFRPMPCPCDGAPAQLLDPPTVLPKLSTAARGSPEAGGRIPASRHRGLRRIQPLLAAPGAARRLIHCCCDDHRLQPRRAAVQRGLPAADPLARHPPASVPASPR